MKRRQLFELTDQDWCPTIVRSLVTDFIESFVATVRLHRPMEDKLSALLKKTGATRIVDLCSGSGGPLVSIQRGLRARGQNVEVVLSDKYPDASRLAEIAGRAEGVSYFTASVDATDVPEDLAGVRTLFEGLHHFEPEAARAILQNAVDREEPIAVFEITHRSWFGVASTFALPLTIPLFTPLIRPFRWSRLALTYLLPVAPAAIFWDSFVSNLRSYTTDELRDMTASLEGRPYQWDIGSERVLAFRVTYAVGVPAD
mgnify:CR=1 FL=1